MSNKTDALHKGLKQMLNYLPMIYNQQASANNTGEIIIKYPYDSIPNNALLFVLPSLYRARELRRPHALVKISFFSSFRR